MSGSLLRAEVHRFRSRRFIVLLLLMGLATFVVVVGAVSTQFAKPTAQGLAEAQQRVDELVAEQQRARPGCLESVPPGEDPELFCGPADASQFQVEDFVDKQAFAFEQNGPDGAIGVAGATAALLFLLGATWVGAEWSSRSMVALLFWEPRRWKVLLTKLGVLLAAAAGVAVVMQALWLGAARLLGATRGTTDVPAGFYGDLLGLQGRAVVLGVCTAALGFGLANLIRNTGAALGFGFVYFVILENAIRALRPSWQPWLISNNFAALMSPGGHTIQLGEITVDDQGKVSAVREIVLSHLHGGLFIGGVALGIVLLGGVLFARRDLH